MWSQRICVSRKLTCCSAQFRLESCSAIFYHDAAWQEYVSRISLAELKVMYKCIDKTLAIEGKKKGKRTAQFIYNYVPSWPTEFLGNTITSSVLRTSYMWWTNYPINTDNYQIMTFVLVYIGIWSKFVMLPIERTSPVFWKNSSKSRNLIPTHNIITMFKLYSSSSTNVNKGCCHYRHTSRNLPPGKHMYSIKKICDDHELS